MKKYLLPFLLLLILLSTSTPAVAMDPSYPITSNYECYEGLPKVDNEIIALVTIECDHCDNAMRDIFDSFDWNKFEVKTSWCSPYSECQSVDDVFQVNYSKRQVEKNDNLVLIKVPIKILKDGRGLVRFVYHLSGKGLPPTEFSPGIYIKTDSDVYTDQVFPSTYAEQAIENKGNCDKLNEFLSTSGFPITGDSTWLMNSKIKWEIIIVSLLLVIIVIMIIYRKRSRNNKKDSTSNLLK